MNSKGFSIIELIVSMAIIAILSVIIIPSYREANQDLFVQEEARQLVRAIESVRAMAIASRNIGIGGISQGRDYRIRIGRNHYEIFVVLNQNNQTQETIIRRENFSRGVVARNIIEANENVISFSPPDPEIIFFRDNQNVNEMQINIGYGRYIESGIEWWQWEIFVNKAGLVELKRNEI